MTSKTRSIGKDQNTEIKKTQEQMNEILQRSFRYVAATPEGQVVLNHLMNLCGYHSIGSMSDAKTGEILINNTIHNEAIRGVWAKLRLSIPQKDLQEIEYMNLRKKAKELIVENIGE